MSWGFLQYNIMLDKSQNSSCLKNGSPWMWDTATNSGTFSSYSMRITWPYTNWHKFYFCRHVGCKIGGTCSLLSDWKNQHRWVSTRISLKYQTLTWMCVDCRPRTPDHSGVKVSLRELFIKVQWEDDYIAISKIFRQYLFDRSRVPSLQFNPMIMELSAVTEKMGYLSILHCIFISVVIEIFRLMTWVIYYVIYSSTSPLEHKVNVVLFL